MARVEMMLRASRLPGDGASVIVEVGVSCCGDLSLVVKRKGGLCGELSLGRADCGSIFWG